jgi:hypothetical protein
MQNNVDKKQAAHAIGIQPNTVYKWPAYVDEVIQLMAVDITQAALQLRKKSVFKAMVTKVEGLDSDHESIRQKVASEILAAELGTSTVTAAIPASDDKVSSGQSSQLNGRSSLFLELATGMQLLLSQPPSEKQAIVIAEYESCLASFTKLKDLVNTFNDTKLEEPTI